MGSDCGTHGLSLVSMELMTSGAGQLGAAVSMPAARAAETIRSS